MSTINGTEGADSLTGSNAGDQIYGFGGDDTLVGGTGADVLDGGAGADSMRGGGGADVFYVDNVGDVVRAESNQTTGPGVGTIIVTSVSYSLADTKVAEIRAVQGAGPINLTGTLLAEKLTGNDSANRIDGGEPVYSLARDTLQGLGGDDTYIVYGTNNLVFEDAGGGNDTVLFAFNQYSSTQEYALADNRNSTGVSAVERLAMADPSATYASSLTGNAYDQTIVGNAGSNTLSGGGGIDTLIGLRGDDIYVVSDSTTVVIEQGGEGADQVLTSVSYALAQGASVEMLSARDQSATTAINLTGNALAQTITGNMGANVIVGGGGADVLIGLGGNDTFLVTGQGETVVEGNGGGADLVYTTASYNLGVNEVEALSTVQQSDTTAINLIGNYVSQTIVGNYGDNVINGGSGIDTLIGLFGNDTYAVGDSRIVIQEQAGQGFDTVVTSVGYTLAAGVSVEQMVAQDRSSTAGLVLIGNEVAQTIGGASGADTLNGGLGADTLIGFGGADTFVFSTALGNGNVDTLVDFTRGTDRIALSSGIFGAIGTSLDANEFVTGTAAGTVDQRIVYNAASGQLFYDADGSGTGAAILFAQISPGTALAVADFTVVAPATVGA